MMKCRPDGSVRKTLVPEGPRFLLCSCCTSSPYNILCLSVDPRLHNNFEKKILIASLEKTEERGGETRLIKKVGMYDSVVYTAQSAEHQTAQGSSYEEVNQPAMATTLSKMFLPPTSIEGYPKRKKIRTPPPPLPPTGIKYFPFKQTFFLTGTMQAK